MKTFDWDVFDWTEKTKEILRADDEALVRESRHTQESLAKLKIVLDDCINLSLSNRMQIDLLQAQIKLQSRRIDALTDLNAVLKEWEKKNDG